MLIKYSLLAIIFISNGLLFYPHHVEAQFSSMLRNSTNSIQRTIRNQVRQALKPKIIIKSGALKQVSAISMDSTSRFMATSLSNKTAGIWDFKKGAEIWRFKSRKNLLDVQVNQSGTTLAGLSEDGNFYLGSTWEDEQLTLVKAIKNITALAFINDNTLALGKQSGKVILWDIRNAKSSNHFIASDKTISALTSINAQQLLITDNSGKINLWSVENGIYRVGNLSWSAGNKIQQLSASKTNDIFIALTHENTLKAFNLKKKNIQWSIDNIKKTSTLSHNNLAVLDQSNNIKVINFNGKVIHKRKSPLNTPTDIALGAADNSIFIAGEGGQIKIGHKNAAVDKWLTLYSTKSSWASIDSVGRYDGTEEAFSDLAWDTSEQSLDIGRFSRNYFEPGLASQKPLSINTASTHQTDDEDDILANASSISEVKPLITQPKHTIADGIYMPPFIKISLDGSSASPASGQSVKINIEAIADQYAIDKIKEINLYQNGKRLKIEAKPLQTKAVDTNRVSKEWLSSLTLTPGKNTIKAVIYGWNNVSSVSEPLTIEVADASIFQTKIIAAGIGIDVYTDDQLKLNFAVADAVGFTDKLSDETLLTDADSIVTLTLDGNASNSGIKKQLDSLKSVGAQDLVVLFLSGHGRTIGKDWYFLSHNAQNLEDENHVKNNSISSEQLATALLDVPAQRILLVIDACQSGAAIENFNNFNQRRSLKGLSDNTGVQIIAATRADQLAPEYNALGHGIFTYTLLNGMSKNKNNRFNADRWPADGKVMVGELQKFTEIYVPKLAQILAKRNQDSKVLGRGLIDSAPVTPVGSIFGKDFKLY